MSAVADYQVIVDGVDITPRLKGAVLAGGRAPRVRLAGLRLTEKRGGDADQLELTIDDTDGAAPFPRAGATVAVRLGWAAGQGVEIGLVDKGSFVVDEVAHGGPPDLVTVRARAADLAGPIRTRREQSWRATTLGAIVRQLAARNSLVARVAPALASVAVAALTQSRESDMALLRRLGREHDATATIKAGALIFAPVGSPVTATGQAIPGLTIRRGDGDRHDFGIEKREEAGAVEAQWHDRRGARRQTVRVGSGEGAPRRLSRTYPSEAAARQAATAENGRQGRAPRKLSLTLALGRLDIYPDRPVTVSGFKAEIDDTRWLVESVTHDLAADRGFTSAVQLESAG